MELENQNNKQTHAYAEEDNYADISDKSAFINNLSSPNSLNSPEHIHDQLTTNCDLSSKAQTQNWFAFPQFKYDQKNEQGEEGTTDKKICKKEKKIKKQKKESLFTQMQRRQLVTAFQYKQSHDDQIVICNGLSISRDGIVRFQHCVGQVSFGFNTNENYQVTYFKDTQLVEIKKSQFQYKGRVSIEEAVKYLATTPCKMFEQAKSALLFFQNKRDELHKKLHPADKIQIFLKDEEMLNFIKQCQKYMEIYNNTNSSDIFTYDIARLNVVNQDIEVTNVGYSKLYLDLIGIDLSNFNSLLLRKQKIDLVQDKEELMQQSIKALNKRLNQSQDVVFPYNIKTFDGFPLKIEMRQQLCLLPSAYQKNIFEVPPEYVLAITTIDIDDEQLENLIKYRERLLYQKDQLSFDEFINKELSYLFENVEYSVHSQSFIDKFYKDNINNLQKFEKQKHQQRVRSDESQKQRKCGFQIINPEQISVEIPQTL